MFGSIPVLYLLDVSSTHPWVVTTKNVCRYHQMSLAGAKSTRLRTTGLNSKPVVLKLERVTESSKGLIKTQIIGPHSQSSWFSTSVVGLENLYFYWVVKAPGQGTPLWEPLVLVISDIPVPLNSQTRGKGLPGKVSLLTIRDLERNSPCLPGHCGVCVCCLELWQPSCDYGGS